MRVQTLAALQKAWIMTEDEVSAQIERDIGEKGYALVPVAILRAIFPEEWELFPAEMPRALRDFAERHGWNLEQSHTSPGMRIVFSPRAEQASPSASI